MEFIKKHKLKISLIFITAITAILCMFLIVNYKSNAISGQNMSSYSSSNSHGFRGGQAPDNQIQNSPRPRTNPPVAGFPKNNSGNYQGGTSNSVNNNNNGQHSVKNFTGGFRNNRDGRGFNRGANNQIGGQSYDSGSIASTTNSGVSKGILIFAVLFLVMVIGASISIFKKKIKTMCENKKIIVIFILAIGFLLRLAAATLMNGHNDINLFKSWAETAAKDFAHIYSNGSNIDYPPLYLYILAGIGKLANISLLNKYYILFLKLPAILADIISAYLIYRLSEKYLRPTYSLLLASFYLFNPAVFINSTFWGQVDSFFTLLLILAVYFMSENKIPWTSVFFTLAVLMKPQGIIFLPILFFELVNQRDIKNFIKAGLSAVATTAIIILPFSLNNGITWIFKLYTGTVNEYPYGSVNAFNFFGLLGANFKLDNIKLGPLSYHSWGMLFIVLITAFCWFIYIKGKNLKLGFAAALLLITGVFTFSTSMHERYLFPAVALSMLAFIYLKDIRLLFISMGYSITVFVNTYYVLFNLSGSNGVSYNPSLIITSIMNVLLFAYLVKVLWNITTRDFIGN